MQSVDYLSSKPEPWNPRKAQSLSAKEMTSTGNDDPWQRIGPYRLETQLGAGGMGEVYRAHDERLGRRVAIKRIRHDRISTPNARKRFLREARMVARLSHPGIVGIHDILEDCGSDWIVMELASGQTLKQHLVSGPLPWRRAAQIGLGISSALHAAHLEGIVHRDLKPGNVMVDGADEVKILDFGLAKQALFPTAESSLTVEGQILGTPHAMSPEQAMGEKVASSSDLFSLGSLLYEILTGEAPFQAADPVESLRRVCTHHPPSVLELAPSTPPGLSSVVEHLLDKEPGRRPRNAGWLVQALKNTLQRSQTEVVADTLSGRSRGGLEETDRSSFTLSSGSLGAEGERRRVTVLCCELLSDNGTARSMDPESFYGAFSAFEELARETIEGFGGHVASCLGHRLVAYFGYPRADELDAAKAARAALELVDRFRFLRRQFEAPEELAIRAGLHTAWVIVLDDAGSDRIAAGQGLDFATRLQQMASPGQVVVSKSTQRLITKCRFESLGESQLSSASTPETVYRLLDIPEISSRWQVPSGLTPFVARNREIEFLLGLWDSARAGHGQMVLVTGEAGIGKSRLLQMFRDRVPIDALRWLTAQGSPQSINSPLLPILEVLRRILKVDRNQASRRQLNDLEEALQERGFEPAKIVPLLAPLLGLALDERYPPLGLSPPHQKKLTLEAIVELVSGQAIRKPVILVIEDLQWMDPTTIDLLERLMTRASRLSLLIVLTSRPDFEPPWRDRQDLTQLNLTNLTRSEVSELIDRLTEHKPLPSEIHEKIWEKSDGVPLFVEEFVTSVLDSKVHREKEGRFELADMLESLNVPETLQHSLTARLDRLGPAKEIILLASVIGREFSHELLTKVAAIEAADIEGRLASLLEAGLIYRRGFSFRSRYYFKHNLIQETAYQLLLRSTRKKFHFRIAEVFEDDFPGVIETQPELVAYHFTEAEQRGKAIGYWRRAGQRDVQLAANLEAISHFEKALGLIGSLPPSPQRDLMELGVDSFLGPVMIVNRGFAAPEVERIYARALELCQRAEDSPQLGWILKGLFQYFSTKGGPEASRQIAERLMRHAQLQADLTVRMSAHLCLGLSFFVFEGDCAAARSQHEQALAEYRRDSEEIQPVGSEHPCVEHLCCLAHVLWNQGYPDSALERVDEALDLAREVSQGRPTPAQAWALSTKVLVHHSRREYEAVSRWASEAFAVCEEIGVPLWMALTQTFWGSARAESAVSRSTDRSDPEVEKEIQEGISTIQQSLESILSLGGLMASYHVQICLVAASLAIGEVKEELIENALETIAITGERTWEAELYRLSGAISVYQDAESPETVAEGERSFQKALTIARAQGAKSLELRAAIGLSRLWRSHRRSEDARELLEKVYSWFTEGLDTGDLKEARHLLSELCQD